MAQVWKIIEIDLKMDYFWTSATVCDYLTTRANKDLQIEQKLHHELRCKLIERLHSFDIQTNILKQYLPYNPEKPNSIALKMIQSSNKFKQLILTLKCEDERLATGLVRKQINLEEVAHYRDLLKVYEEKIFEMSCNLYCKEVDISVDQIGKRQNEKPTFRKLRSFSRAQTELNNIDRFVKQICKCRARLKSKVFTDKLKPQTMKSNVKTDKNEMDGISTEESAESHEKQTNKIDGDTVFSEKDGKAEKRFLLVQSEKEQFLKRERQPFENSLLDLLKAQLQKQRTLKSELRQLSKQYKMRNLTHKKLAQKCHTKIQ